MRNILLLVSVSAFVLGCWNSTGPGETETFDLGYGESVADCNQKAADAVCRDLGWARATAYECRTVPVNSPLGYWEQDVMFKVTCWRPLQ